MRIERLKETALAGDLLYGRDNLPSEANLYNKENLFTFFGNFLYFYIFQKRKQF